MARPYSTSKWLGLFFLAFILFSLFPCRTLLCGTEPGRLGVTAAPQTIDQTSRLTVNHTLDGCGKDIIDKYVRGMVCVQQRLEELPPCPSGAEERQRTL